MELLVYVLERLRSRIEYRGEEGMTTAELLGNAALGVLALVAIWTVLQALGVDIVNWMRDQLIN
jgi:hypothetical protein